MPSSEGGEGNRGATAVEFALIVPIFLLIILFMVDAGRMLFVQAALQDSAHLGARAASIGAEEDDVIALTIEASSAAVAMSGSHKNSLEVILVSACPAVYDPTMLNSATVSTAIDFTFFTPIELIQQFDKNSKRPGSVLLTQEAQWLCTG